MTHFTIFVFKPLQINFQSRQRSVFISVVCSFVIILLMAVHLLDERFYVPWLKLHVKIYVSNVLYFRSCFKSNFISQKSTQFFQFLCKVNIGNTNAFILLTHDGDPCLLSAQFFFNEKLRLISQKLFYDSKLKSSRSNTETRRSIFLRVLINCN